MNFDRLQFVRTENGIDYYFDKMDPRKTEFGIPTTAIAHAPRKFCDGKQSVRSIANFPIYMPTRDGCYRVGGVGGGA